MLAHAARGSNGALTDLNLRNWSAIVHYTEEKLQLRLYLEDRGTTVSPLAVHLEAHKVVGSNEHVQLHIEDSPPLLDVEGSDDNWHT